MTTIKEIAQKAGVSIGTVDRVIHNRGIVNAQTKERVLSVMEELNYKPNSVAQGLAARKKKLKLCYLMMNPMFVHFMKKVKEAAEEKAEALKQYGVQVTFYVLSIEDVYENEENSELLDSLKEQDGLAVFGVETTAIQLFLDEADKWGFRLCFIIRCWRIETFWHMWDVII